MAAANTLDIIIRAQDQTGQALQKVQQGMAQVQQASTRTAGSLGTVGQQSLSVSRQFSSLSASTRFAAASVLTELNPALARATTQIAALSTVAGTMGSLLTGGLVIGAIGLLGLAIATWIRRTNEQIEAQQRLNRQVASFDTAGIAQAIGKLTEEIELATAKTDGIAGRLGRALGEGFAASDPFASFQGTPAEQVREINEELGKLQAAFEKVRVPEFAAQMAGLNAEQIKLLQSQRQAQLAQAESIPEAERTSERLVTLIQAEEQARLEQLGFEEQRTKARAEVSRLGEAEILRIEEGFAAKRTNLELETANRIEGIRKQHKEKVKAIVDEAEREAGAKADEEARRSGERIDKIFEGIRKQRETIERTMTTLGHAVADALFDAIIGRRQRVEEILKAFYQDLLRDLFRTTVTTALGGRAQGLSLQQLFRR